MQNIDIMLFTSGTDKSRHSAIKNAIQNSVPSAVIMDMFVKSGDHQCIVKVRLLGHEEVFSSSDVMNPEKFTDKGAPESMYYLMNSTISSLCDKWRKGVMSYGNIVGNYPGLF